MNRSIKESLLNKLFGFEANTMQIRTELMAGLTTFLTMSYILAVNPDILSVTGMDKGAVFTATALSAAIATFLIAFLAKLPLAQAPSMGINAFFAYTLVLAMGYSWQTALAATFVEGIIFILLTTFNIRSKIINSLPKSLCQSISTGIGFFIAFIGLKNVGLIQANESTLVSLGEFTTTSLIGVFGILLSGVMMALRVRGALFYSIIASTAVAAVAGVIVIPEGFSPISMPKSLAPTFLQLDFKSLLSLDMLIIVVLLVFMDLFNTLGTLIGAASQSGLMDKNGNITRMKEAMMADAVGTTLGAALGTSTVTTFVESTSGIAEGGRSGLTALSTGTLFLLSLFAAPLFLLIPSYATSGALVIVGVLMTSSIKEIDFTDLTEATPAFLTIIMMVLTYSIFDGIAIGVITYTILKFCTGRRKELHPAIYVLALLFVVQYMVA